MSEKKYIIPQQHQIQKKDRNRLSRHPSLVVWFTGLSGSGKSTLANLLEQKLYAEGIHTYILDGDNVRAGLNKDLGFSAEDRQENIRRIGEVAKLMADAGLVVLSAFISPLKSDRQLVSDLLPEEEFVEVFVDCPLEICEQRDVKGLYAKARAGLIKNFTGIDAPFEAPKKPTLHIQTHLQSQEEALALLYEEVRQRLEYRE